MSFEPCPPDLTVARISSFLDYTADELNGKSIYTLCHGQDAHKLKKSHSERKCCMPRFQLLFCFNA